LLFTPDVAGTYTILLFANDTAYSAGLPSATVTITTAGVPATASITAYGSSFAKSAAATSQTGALLKVTLADAAGNAIYPTNSASYPTASGTAYVTSGFSTDASTTNLYVTGGSVATQPASGTAGKYNFTCASVAGSGRSR